MGKTFYTALGVDPDADAETIREAYRKQVKEAHPDVNDDDDAAEAFKRLTAARDVLLDDSRRSRYDRVGHDAYVRHHLDSNAWSGDSQGKRRRRSGNSRSTGRSRSRSSRSADTSGADSGRTRGNRSGNRRGSGRDSGGDRKRRRSRTASGGSNRSGGDRTGAGRSASSGTARSSGDTGETDRTGRTENAENYQRYRSEYTPSGSGNESGDGGDWSTESGRDWAFTDRRTQSTTGRSTDPTERGRTDFWDATRTNTNGYATAGQAPSAAAAREVGVTSVGDAARQVGPWFAFHFVFLVSAFVTVWLVVAWSPSILIVFGSLLLLGMAVFFSILHMVSRVFS